MKIFPYVVFQNFIAFFFHIKVCNSSRMYCCVIVNWEDFDFIFFYMDTQ